MICHVCQQGATGQCKNCGKFYCPEHGDVYCVACRQEPAPGGEGASRTSPQEAPSEGVFVFMGARCYHCNEPAGGKCDKCGKHFCPRHGMAVPKSFDSTLRLVCSECMAGQQALGCVIGLVIFAVMMMVVAILVGQR